MKSEFEFIKSLRKKFDLPKIGDDCAVLPQNSRTEQVITVDLLVEDIDFRLVWTKPEFIGHKALAVSLSDVAAMGAKPVWSMVSIGIPENIWKTDFVDEFYDGYMRLAKKFKVELVGGDVSKTPNKIVIDSIAGGTVEKGKAVLRSTARVGDLIFVTGELGGACAGLRLLEMGVHYDGPATGWQKTLLLKQLQPFPFCDSTEFTEFATSMIDLSDGLSSDLAHICNASEVGAKIFADKIPIHPQLRNLSSQKMQEFLSENMDILGLALNGGEDFELLFTVNPENFENFKKKSSPHFTQIGEITQDIGKIELIHEGKGEILKAEGYTHF